jgi:hypothetical protein
MRARFSIKGHRRIGEIDLFADRFDGITGSAIRDIFKIIAVPGMISFAGGNPAAEALRNDVLADIARDALLAAPSRVWGG